MSHLKLSLETHAYDGNSALTFLYELLPKPSSSLNDARNGLKAITNSQNAIDAIELVFSGPKEDEKKINVHNLLCLLWDFCRYNGMDGYIVEQLEDIILNGPCIQGRSMRLIQIVNTLY